jgi:energy-converting hydrogenase Eha subunit F
MQKYRFLTEGETLQEGDERLDDYGKWFNVTFLFGLEVTPFYAKRQLYRRPVQETEEDNNFLVFDNKPLDFSKPMKDSD